MIKKKPRQNHENHENVIIPNPKFNAKHLKQITKLILPLYNYEYHEIHGIPQYNYENTKKNIFHARITKIMKI